MNFDNPEKKREALNGAFEIMAERYARVVDAVNRINQIYPEAIPTQESTYVSPVNNVVNLSQMVDREMGHDDYIQGLEDAA